MNAKGKLSWRQVADGANVPYGWLLKALSGGWEFQEYVWHNGKNFGKHEIRQQYKKAVEAFLKCKESRIDLERPFKDEEWYRTSPEQKIATLKKQIAELEADKAERIKGGHWFGYTQMELDKALTELKTIAPSID